MNFFERLRDGQFKNIIIFSGAGVSVNSGIPDYRSSNGIFSHITNPEKAFCRNSEYYKKMFPKIKNKMNKAKPTFSHKLAFILNQKGLLRRVYTQNIDGLYQKAGLNDNMIVEFHGSVTKDNIVLYGDNISTNSWNMVKEDLIKNVNDIDLIIVMGTSLQVAPFCGLVNMVKKNCCRVLVDVNPENCFNNNFTGNNVEQKFFKYCGRQISLQSWWEPFNNSFKGKWKDQYIIKNDTDTFSKIVMEQC